MRSVRLFALLMLFVTGSAFATVFLPLTDRQMVDRSDAIVVGTITESATRIGANGYVFTDYQMSVEDILKGSAGGVITISEVGGLHESRGMLIEGSATYRVGERVLVFLRQGPNGTYYTSAMTLGRFTFGRNVGGEPVVVRDLGDEMPNEPVRLRDPFMDFIRDAAQGKTAASSSYVSATPESALRHFVPTVNGNAKAYALTGAGFPIRWPCPAPPATCSDKTFDTNKTASAAENTTINQGLSQWTVDPNANIALARGGVFTPAAGDPALDGHNVIYLGQSLPTSFGFCDAGIACTVDWLNTNTQNSYDGDTWLSILEADIVALPSFTTNLAVLLHEFGHAIGIRHSNQGTPSTSAAVMNSSVSFTTLQSWDHDAVDSIYGTGPGCQPITSVTINGGDRSLPSGSTGSLRAVPVPADPGSGPSVYTYQWYIGTSGDTSRPDSGGTQQNYTTPPVTQVSNFWVQVKNACTTGGVNSPTSTLTPTISTCDKPVITTQPASQMVGSGTTVTLTVNTSGTAPFSYEWYQGSTGDVSTMVATTPSFTTSPITSQTNFWVRVKNSCGTADSNTAVISLIGQCAPPAFTLNPASLSPLTPRTLALVATASGAGITYQWFNAVAPTEANPLDGHTPSDSRFVRMVYVDLLGRDPDSSTTGILIGLLNGGATHQALALQVLTSSEYKTTLIGSYFQQYLRRASDPVGVAFYLPLLGTSFTDEDVAASFLGSDEYFTRIAGGTSTGFINLLFNDVLGRSPSASEISSYTTFLTNGVSRSDIALLVLHSTEARTKLVQGWFNALLRRPPSSDELNTFVGALSNGQTDEQVMASIVGSNEYSSFGTVTIIGPTSGQTSYWVKATNSCPKSANSTTATITVVAGCSASAPPTILTQPANTSTITGVPGVVGVGVTGAGPFSFQWFEGNRGDTSRPINGAIRAQLSLLTNTVTTRTVWVRITNSCNQSTDSSTASINVACGAPAPRIFADTSVRSDIPHKVSWEGDSSLYSSFELQVAKTENFSDAQTTTVPAVQLPAGSLNEKLFTDTVTTDTRFYYRVRGKALCNGTFSAFSGTATTLVTAPQAPTTPNVVVNVGGNTTFGVITQNLFIPGFGASGKNALATTGTFTVTSDRPYVTVVPSSGPLPPEGTTVQVKIDPSGLDIGSTQSNLVITTTDGLGKNALGASKTTSTSVSVSKTTPATPTAKTANAPPDTLIVLAVGHGVGGSGPFQSDVRITNTGTTDTQYQLTFTPAAVDGTTTGRQTTMTIHGGETKALDDIVSTWFAAGGLGEANLGTLEVRPLALSTGTNPPGRKTTVAASRTFFVKADGSTFGQFIPALPVANFLAKGNAKISLQAIQQNTAARSNIGLVEGSGQPADVELKLLDKNNNQIAITSAHMRGFEFFQRSLGDFFGSSVNTADARLEVKVTSDAGKISAYASIVDNKTTDPTLVFPAVPSQVQEKRYVVPGVANLIGALGSNFHTDMRIFNAAATAVPVTMTFSGPKPAATQTFTLQPGEIRTFNDIVKQTFQLDGVGGAVVATTTANSSLVLTAKTYTLNPDGGTFGQFIPGVSPSDGIGVNESALQLPQLEQSPAFRSNLGVVEVSGQAPTMMKCTKPEDESLTACVRLTLINPDAKTTPTVDVALGPNQFVQLGNVFASAGMPTVYNGRITAQVLRGNGRVSAYGSVIDNRSNDPTFVPAQK